MTKKQISVLSIAIISIVLIVACNVVTKVVRSQLTFNATSANPSSDISEKLFMQKPNASRSMMASGGQTASVNSYSAWLLICKAPPITNAEEDCDPPTRLH